MILNNNYWNIPTVIFYFCIVVISYVSSKVNNNISVILPVSRKKINAGILVPFLFLSVIRGVSTCGTDVLEGYKLNFISATSLSNFRDNTTEIGYRIITVVSRCISDNYSSYIFLMAILTIIPIYFCVKEFKEIIDVPTTIAGYVSIFFYQGFSLIRIYLAASIICVAVMLLYKGKNFYAFICIMVASLFHATAIINIIIWFAVSFRIDKKMLGLSAILGVVMIYISRNQIAALFTGRYRYYIANDKLTFGTEFIWFYFLPIVLFVYIVKYRKNISIRHFKIFKLTFLWVCFGCVVSLLQYAIPMFGRMSVYSLPMIIFVGCGLDILRKAQDKYYKFFKIVFLIYFLFRLYIYLVGYYNMDGIMPYRTILGITI